MRRGEGGIGGRGWMRAMSENHDSIHIHDMVHDFYIFESYSCHDSCFIYLSPCHPTPNFSLNLP